MKFKNLAKNLKEVIALAKRENRRLLSVELCPNKPINLDHLAKIPVDFASVIWHNKKKVEIIQQSRDINNGNEVGRQQSNKINSEIEHSKKNNGKRNSEILEISTKRKKMEVKIQQLNNLDSETNTGIEKPNNGGTVTMKMKQLNEEDTNGDIKENTKNVKYKKIEAEIQQSNHEDCKVKSERDETHNEVLSNVIELTKRVTNATDIAIKTNLRCKDLSKWDARLVLEGIKASGIRNIFVVRGDYSKEERNNIEFLRRQEFKYACDLVKFIHEIYGDYFSIGVAAYPSMHPESQTVKDDLNFLKHKINSGADFIITQMEFDTMKISNFLENLRKHNINVPILIGMYVIHSYSELMAMSRVCHIQLPANVMKSVESLKNDKDALVNYGQSLANRMLEQILCQNGNQIAGIHFYTLNNFEYVQKVISKNTHLLKH